MGLLKTILILLAIYFFFKLVVRVILPFILTGFIKKKQQEFQERYQDIKKKPEGEITIEYNKEKKGKRGDEDYVDYEEIK